MAVILAEVSLGLDTIAGGTVTGMLIATMAAFMRRTKETDDRRDDASRARDEASKLIMDEALKREAFAWAERDKALAERDAARAETERIRRLHEEDRQRWMEDRRWVTETHESKVKDLQRRLKEDPTGP